PPQRLLPMVGTLSPITPDSDEIGVAATRAARFMPATLRMLRTGAAAYVLRKRRARDTLRVDAAHATRDLSFFLVLYTVALILALLPGDLHFLKGYIGWIFLPAYFVYLFTVLRTPKATP